VVFSADALSVTFAPMSLSSCSLWRDGRIPPPSLLSVLVRMAFAIKGREPLLLVGPSSFKSHLIQAWSELTQRTSEDERCTIFLTAETESAGLLGEVRASSVAELVQRLPTHADQLHQRWRKIQAGSASTPHVTRAMERAEELLQGVPHSLGKDAARSLRQLVGEYRRVILELFAADAPAAPTAAAGAAGAAAAHADADPAAAASAEPTDAAALGSNMQQVLNVQALEQELLESQDAPTEALVGEASVSADDFLLVAEDPAAFSSTFGFDSSSADDFQLVDGASAAFGDPFSDPFAAPADPFASSFANGGGGGMESTEVDVSNADQHDGANGGESKDEEEQKYSNEADAEPEVSLFDQLVAALPPASASQAKARRLPTMSQSLLDRLASVVGAFRALFKTADDACGLLLTAKFESYVEAVQQAMSQSEPIFVFRDGPVTLSAKLGKLLVLEDYDAPSQAVTERLNSLFESTPYFAVTEDFSISALVEGQAASGSDLPPLHAAVALPADLTIIATVHSEPGQTMRISPATMSRFTVIAVEPYDEREMQEILQKALESKTLGLSDGDAVAAAELCKLACDFVLAVRRHLYGAGLESSCDIHQLMRLAAFLSQHDVDALSDVSAVSGSTVQQALRNYFLRLVQIGTRFFLLDQQSDDKQQEVLKTAATDVRLPLFANVLGFDFESDISQSLEDPIMRLPDGRLLLRHYGLVVQQRPNDKGHLLSDAEFQQLLATFHATPTVVNNLARVFASITAGSALLLEGPPGTGQQQWHTRAR